ncbi:hypothetical protein DXG01_016205, partial [Tephrocybe rancida]
CAIPAFEGLLDEPHNSNLMDLLFTSATWHGLAKLRLHTDHTLKLLDEETVRLGQTFRHFVQQTCSKFNTRELPREAAARVRKHQSSSAKGAPAAANSAVPPAAPTASLTGVSTAAGTERNLTGRRPKTLNLNTYKFHSIGDVAGCIRRYGTTDSYSTEI